MGRVNRPDTRSQGWPHRRRNPRIRKESLDFRPPSRDLGILNNTLSTTFAPAYEASGDLHGACLAVRDHITANLDSFQAIWEYGYANPTFDAEDVCPF